MLAATTWQGRTDTVNTRTAALGTIGLIVVLLAIVALASLFAGDISERSLTIITTVLSSFATVLAGLLLFLRVETVNGKVDDAATLAATAAIKAAIAAEQTSAVERKVDAVHHDVLNGGLRENVKRAIRETEQEPDVREHRIENVAKGVSKDRHDKANREAAASARAQMEERVRRRTAGEESPC